MCMAIPSRVVAVASDMATVEAFGKQRNVSLLLMNDAVNLGDYLLVQAGGFAYERVEHDAALQALQLFDELADI